MKLPRNFNLKFGYCIFSSWGHFKKFKTKKKEGTLRPISELEDESDSDMSELNESDTHSGESESDPDTDFSEDESESNEFDQYKSDEESKLIKPLEGKKLKQIFLKQIWRKIRRFWK